MIVAKIKYPCQVCGNKQSWYLMPEDSKTISNDIVPSSNKFLIQCKKCGQTYRLSFNIKRLEKRSK